MGTEVSCAGRVKPSFVIFDIQALWSGHSDAQGWASECPDVNNYKWQLNRSGTGCFIAVPIWQRWASKGWWISLFINHHYHCFSAWLCHTDHTSE